MRDDGNAERRENGASVSRVADLTDCLQVFDVINILLPFSVDDLVFPQI